MDMEQQARNAAVTLLLGRLLALVVARGSGVSVFLENEREQLQKWLDGAIDMDGPADEEARCRQVVSEMVDQIVDVARVQCGLPLSPADEPRLTVTPVDPGQLP